MATVIGVGIAAVDIINFTDGFPREDDEVRAQRQDIRRGGNTANTLVVLSQLGHRCRWLGTLADDLNSMVIGDDFARYNIDTTGCEIITGGKTPTSYITLNQRNGSRTIVHYRDLPELSATAMNNIPLQHAHWVHFEGRNETHTRYMIDHVKKQHASLPVSIEIEKPRDQLDLLLNAGADVYFFSRALARAQNFASAGEMLKHYRQTIPHALLVCPWGEQGAYALEQDRLLHAPAIDVDPVVDTIGAGDTFNAGFIHARLSGKDTLSALQYACGLAAKKCALEGFEGLANEA
ncbi:MAG: PfkB family carbohydrate kinase [Gammaproteobacteria bacterium]|jgi:ketohexokinase